MPKDVSSFENPLNIVDQGAHEPVFLHNDELKWEDLGAEKGATSLHAMPKGLKRAIIFGDPNKPGLCVFRMHYPKNYKVPAHFHWMAEHTLVLTGEVWVGLGEKIDPSKFQKYGPGDFFTMPVGQGHYVETRDNSPIFQLHVIGPWRMTYCNPDDHPHK